MVQLVNGEIVITLDPKMTQAQLRVYGDSTHMDITMDILAHRAKILHKQGLYTKVQYGDGSMLISSIYEIYVGLSADKACWCREEAADHSPLCRFFRKKNPISTGV